MCVCVCVRKERQRERSLKCVCVCVGVCVCGKCFGYFALQRERYREKERSSCHTFKPLPLSLSLSSPSALFLLMLVKAPTQRCPHHSGRCSPSPMRDAAVSSAQFPVAPFPLPVLLSLSLSLCSAEDARVWRQRRRGPLLPLLDRLYAVHAGACGEVRLRRSSRLCTLSLCVFLSPSFSSFYTFSRYSFTLSLSLHRSSIIVSPSLSVCLSVSSTLSERERASVDVPLFLLLCWLSNFLSRSLSHTHTCTHIHIHTRAQLLSLSLLPPSLQTSPRVHHSHPPHSVTIARSTARNRFILPTRRCPLRRAAS